MAGLYAGVVGLPIRAAELPLGYNRWATGWNAFLLRILAAFPGYQKTNGAVGYFIIDTAKLANSLTKRG